MPTASPSSDPSGGAPRSEPLISLRDASFGYDGRAVVRGVDLDVLPGQLLGISGPNGSGKTTLFRGILGLLPPLAGEVTRRPGTALGYVPQREHLDGVFPLTVEELVRMGAYGRLRGLRILSRREKSLARECLERVGLSEQSHRQFSALSGGQRQRALIARALMAKPDVILLDEPTNGVDRESARQILVLLEALMEAGTSVLLVAHQHGFLRQIAREILWVAGGHVRRGPTSELLENAESISRGTPCR